jgi:hypothetical protein
VLWPVPAMSLVAGLGGGRVQVKGSDDGRCGSFGAPCLKVEVAAVEGAGCGRACGVVDAVYPGGHGVGELVGQPPAAAFAGGFDGLVLTGGRGGCGPCACALVSNHQRNWSFVLYRSNYREGRHIGPRLHGVNVVIHRAFWCARGAFCRRCAGRHCGPRGGEVIDAGACVAAGSGRDALG